MSQGWLSALKQNIIACGAGVIVTVAWLGIFAGWWQTPVFPQRPRLVTLTRIEVEPIQDDGVIRAVNFTTSEGERFTLLGPVKGELLSWLIQQGTDATIMITLVNP